MALAFGVQVGLLGCGSDSSTESTGSSMDPDAAAHIVQARRYLEDGALQSALAHTDTAAAIDSSAADAYFLRGRIYTQLSRYDKAESAYRKALSINPDRQGAWFNIGNNYFRRGQFREALNRYLEEERQHPSPSLYVHMAQSYSNLNKGDSAVYAYKQALEMDSSYAPAHVWLGQHYREDGEYEKALEYTQRALALDSANLKYRFFVGQLLLNTGQPEKAVPHLRRVAREQPWHYAAHYNLGRAFARLGQQEKAEKYMAEGDTLQKAQARIERLETLARENSDEPERWLKLAGALQDIGRFQHAEKAYSVALTLAPGNVGIRNNMANLALARGDTSEAVARYRAILETDSTHANIWVNLGVVYAMTDRRQKALDAWKQALRHDPDHRAASAYISRLSAETR